MRHGRLRGSSSRSRRAVPHRDRKFLHGDCAVSIALEGAARRLAEGKLARVPLLHRLCHSRRTHSCHRRWPRQASSRLLEEQNAINNQRQTMALLDGSPSPPSTHPPANFRFPVFSSQFTIPAPDAAAYLSAYLSSAPSAFPLKFPPGSAFVSPSHIPP